MALPIVKDQRTEFESRPASTRILHWAGHHALIDWVRLGWIVAKPNAESHHDFYSVTVEWLCSCQIVRPIDR